ncbi:MAG: carbohydrate ABC transporter permease [Granulosicoccus sp.]
MINDRAKYGFIFPAFLIVLLVSLFPLMYSLTISFSQVRLVPPTPERFVGFENYATALSNPRFWRSVGNTALISVIAVSLQYIIGLSIAIALNARLPLQSVFRAVFLFPLLMAPIAVALIGKMLFHPGVGPVRDFFAIFGYPDPPFFTDPVWATSVLITLEVWQWTSFVIIVLLAGLQSLPKDVYEAADLENASAWRQFCDITFPLLLPISAAVFLLRMVESFKVMDTVFVLTGGGPGIATETLSLYTYQEGFKKFNLGYTSAVSFLFLILVVVFGTLYVAAIKPHIERRT